MRNRERTWDGGARIQFICHRFAVLRNHILPRGKVKHWIFSCGRNGLQSHADEEEEARQESRGGKSLTFQVNISQ